MSSKPTTESSLGTWIPATSAARRTPTATDVRGDHDRGGARREARQRAQGGFPIRRGVRHVLDVAGRDGAKQRLDRLDVGLLALPDVAQRPTTDERDAPVPQPPKVVDRGGDAAPVVDIHARDQVRRGSLPQGDHRHVGASQVVEEAWLVAHVPEQQDGVDVARLQDRRQGERFARLGVRMTEDDVVSAQASGHRNGLDRAREERVGDIANDGAEEHRRRPVERPCERVGPVAEALGGRQHPAPRRGGDRHRDIVQDPGHRASGHAGGGRDVLHRHMPGSRDRRSALIARPQSSTPLFRLAIGYSKRFRSSAWIETEIRMTAP